jgi:hypothetical protein
VFTIQQRRIMTIIEAAVQVLKRAGRPLSAQEIYTDICKEKLFQFSAKDPVSILKAQLRKNTLGFSGKSAAEKPRLKQDTNKNYLLI